MPDNTITIKIETLVDQAPLEAFTKRVAELRGLMRLPIINVQTFTNLNHALNTAGISMKEFTKSIRELNWGITENGQVFNMLNGKIIDNSYAVQTATRNLRRFKMEWLSIMFAGMALSRAFGGIVNAQMQLWGVTETTSAMWTTVMIPAMEKLTPLLFKLLDFFMSLPEPVQEAIGWLVLAGFALGIIVSTVGQIALTLDALKLFGLTWATAGLAITKFLPILLRVSTVFVGLGLIVKGVYDIIKGKMEGIGIIIAGIGVALITFVGWWALIPIAVGAAVWAIIKYWEPIKEFFATIWRGIKLTFQENWQLILAIIFPPAGILMLFKKYWGPISDFFTTLWKGVTSLFSNAWKSITNALVKAWEYIADVFKDVWEYIKSIPGKIVNAFTGIGKKIASAFVDMMPDWLVKIFKKGISFITKLLNYGNSDVLGSYALGGNISKTGLYMLHKGEEVVPSRQVNGNQTVLFSPSVSVNANVSSNYDVRELADELNEYWARDFERLIKSRGSY